MNSRLINMISSAGNPRITVVGDVILDTYIQGTANRISPEAPIQVLEVSEDRLALGGAANVAANLSNLGAVVELCGVLGEDGNGADLKNLLKTQGIGTEGILVDPGRPTITKTRVIAHNQQLVRIDREVTRNLTEKQEGQLFERLAPLIDQSAAVVLSDYAKGVLSPGLIRKIVDRANGNVLVDPKGTDFARYQGCRLITPNRSEAEKATGIPCQDLVSLRSAAAVLFDRVGVKEVVITLGSKGIYWAEGTEQDQIIPAHSRSVYDVTGAGDTVIALLAFCMAAKISLDDAVRIANAAAGIVVGKLGVAAPKIEELVAFFSSGTTRFMDKILSRDEGARMSERLRRQGEKLVFTNGCFDLIHGGHVQYLRAAKGMGDRLMVGVNDDASIRRLKGDHRPILGLEERMEVLASLQVVDFVVAFSEDTPGRLIESVSPEILIKGEDWKEKGVVGREWVEKHGGQVLLLPIREGYSTTGVIERVLERYGKGKT